MMTQTKKYNEESAVIAIQSFWRRLRNSGRSWFFNPENNKYPEEFRIILNNSTHIPRMLTYKKNIALLEAIEKGNWNSPLFHESKTHFAALNLLALGKIDLATQAVIACVIEQFRMRKKLIIRPILEYGKLNSHGIEELNTIIALPSMKNVLMVKSHKQIENEFEKQINAFPLLLQYSIQVENNPFIASLHLIEVALQVVFGKDAFKSVARLKDQTIDDVDYFIEQQYRPTINGASIYLGLSSEKQLIHSEIGNLLDMNYHDTAHCAVLSKAGRDVHAAIRRIIELAREVFGLKWSKDIWLLVDFDFPEVAIFEAHDELYNTHEACITKLFSLALEDTYSSDALKNVAQSTREKILDKTILFDSDGFPNQILLVFTIDFIQNPKTWEEMHIIRSDSISFSNKHETIINAAQVIKDINLFNSDMKTNVLKLDCFLRNIFIDGIPEMIILPEHLKLQAFLHSKKICSFDETASFSYECIRDNKNVFLGFRKKIPLKRSKLSSLESEFDAFDSKKRFKLM